MSLLTDSLLLQATIVTATLLYLTYRYLTNSFDYWKKRGVQHLKPLPIFGNFKEAALLQTPIGHLLRNFYNQSNGDYLGIWIFGTPFLLIRSPELVRHILVKDFNHFSDRSIASNEKADPISAKVLFMMKNPGWKNMRTKLSPIFTSGKIKAMIPLMDEVVEVMKIYLNEIAEGKQLIDAKEVSAKLMTDIITSCAFGINAGSFKQEDAAFREIGRKMFEFSLSSAFRQTSYFFSPTLVNLFRLTFFGPEVNQFCRTAILETIREREKSGAIRHDLIDAIVEMKRNGTFDGLDKSDDSFVAQGVQFLSAGFETTSSTIAFTLYEMCMNPSMQDRLRDEINVALNEYKAITYEAVQSIKYLDLVIKETLRKYPALPFIDRRCMKDYQIPGTDTIIEKGTPIYIPMFGLHYDAEYFPEPEIYDPERFTEDNEKTRPAYSYIPFGEGPHICIGARFALIAAKIGIVHILSNFRVERCAETPAPIIYEPKSFVLQSTVGLPMRIIKHNLNR